MKEEFLKLIKDAIIDGEDMTHVAIKVLDRKASDNLRKYLEQFGFDLGADLNNEYLTIDLSSGHLNKGSTAWSLPKSYKVFRSATQFIGFGAHCELADKILAKPSKPKSKEEVFWEKMRESLPLPYEKGERQRISITLRSHKLKDDLQNILESFGLKGFHSKRKGTCYINVEGGNIYSVNSETSHYQTVKEFSGVQGFKQFLVNNGFFEDQLSNDSNGSYKIDFKALWENPEVEQKPKNNNTDGERRKEGRVPNIQRASALVTRGTGREGRKVCCEAREALPTRGHCSY